MMLPHPMARTCALLSKTKVFPDGKKDVEMGLSAYVERSNFFFGSIYLTHKGAG